MLDELYCYPKSSVLKNKLNIENEEVLAVAETDLSRAKMQALYEIGLQGFSSADLLGVHRFLFEDVYEWAGQYRNINISKKEQALNGLSIWYTDALDLPVELNKSCAALENWDNRKKSKRIFCSLVAKIFAGIWKVHPFREGNTRATIAFMTLFIESKGFYVNKRLMAECASYIRNAFVNACAANPNTLPLEHLLNDAVSSVPFILNANSAYIHESKLAKRYEKYFAKDISTPHQVRDINYNPKDYSV